MRFSVNGKWQYGYTHDGLLFFAQRIEEMLMYYTSHLYKVPVYNSYLLLEEYAETFSLVQRNSISQTHLSLILEELYHQLRSDYIIKEHYSEDDISYTIGQLKGTTGERQKQYVHYLWHTMSQYPEWCKEEARKVTSSERDKKKIEKVLRSFIPSLIGVGYSPRFIYRHCKRTFSSERICCFEDIDKFLDRFDWKSRDYTVYFAVNKGVLSFKKILESRLGISFDRDKTSSQVQFNEGETPVHINIKALDSDSAAERAYHQFNLFARYYMFLGNRNEEWCGEKAIVKDSEDHIYSPPFMPIGFRYSQDYDRRTLGVSSEYIITNLIENAEREDFYKVDKLIRTHNIALDSPDIGNGFLNLWSVLEIIGVSYHEESKIKEIMNAVIPILKRNYVGRIFEELHDYLKANLSEEEYNSLIDEVKEEGTEEHKIGSLVILDAYDDLRKKAYSLLSNYPVIRSRICQLHKDVFSNKNKLLDELDRYEQRVRWHLQRLYRTRNAIIHSGESSLYLKFLGEHLHDYVDELILEIVGKITSDNSLCSIDNVIIDSQSFMDKIYRDYKNGGSFSEEDIRQLIGKRR